MKERPILMCGSMVRATLADIKTQTRRVMNPQPALVHHCQDRDSYPFEVGYDAQDGRTVAAIKYTMGEIEAHFCPYGQPGDRLWVRETFYHGDAWYEDVPELSWKNCHRDGKCTWIDYAATYANPHGEERDFAWKPSIFMPRWASRITLEVTGVRVERVQEISEEDAKAEGCLPEDWRTKEAAPLIYYSQWSGPNLPPDGYTYRNAYRRLWDSINAERGFPWASNPWVWVIEFRRITEVSPPRRQDAKGEESSA